MCCCADMCCWSAAAHSTTAPPHQLQQQHICTCTAGQQRMRSCRTAAVALQCRTAGQHPSSALDMLRLYIFFEKPFGRSVAGADLDLHGAAVGVMYAPRCVHVTYAGRPKRPCVARIARLGTDSRAHSRASYADAAHTEPPAVALVCRGTSLRIRCF